MEVMFGATINIWAVLVGAVVTFALGALWFSPVLFGHPWMALVGLTEEKIKENPPSPMIYIYCFVVYIFLSYMLAVFASKLGLQTFGDGILLGIAAWVGITLPSTLPNYLFEGRPMKLYAINLGYPFASILIISVIVTLWR